MKFSFPIYQWLIMAGPLTLLVAVVFTVAGGAKLTGNSGMVGGVFANRIWQWFRYFTGILEVGGAVGVLVLTLRFRAAMLIAAVMIGATVANLFILHIPVLAGLTILLMALVLTLAWQWRPAAKTGRS